MRVKRGRSEGEEGKEVRVKRGRSEGKEGNE